MSKISIGVFERRFLSLALLSILFFSGSPSSNAAAYVPGTVNCANYTGNAKAECELKDNFMFDVTTNWTAAKEYGGVPNATTDNPITKKHWFVSRVSNENILYTNLRCDGAVINDAVDNYYANNPCGLNATKTDDYIKSDDLGSDLNVSPPGQEFTVVASSSDVGRTMSSVRIEWETNTTASAPTTWNHGQTCSGGSCKICRQGTLCSGGYAVIPPEDISTQSGGAMNRLWFRVILIDSSALQLVIGGDTNTTDPYRATWTSAKGIPFYQDKYYQFQLCNNSGCSGKCGAAPVINAASVDTSQCASGSPYTFNWTLNKAGQTEFLLNVYDAVTHASIYSIDKLISPVSGSASYSFAPPSLYVGAGGLLQQNHNYTWDLRVKDNAAAVAGQDCKQWSAWYPVVPATLPFTTCTLPACSVSGVTATPSTANFGTNINFTGNISGNGITGFNWKDGATVLGSGALAGTGGAAASAHIFAGSASITKTITLTGTLSNGNICQGTTAVNLVAPSCTAGGIPLTISGGNPQIYGSTLTYSVQKLGVGFATYEMRSSGKGVVSSGAYISGQTVSGSYALPLAGANEVLTFTVKDAGGNSILNCGQSTSFNLTNPTPSCIAGGTPFSISPGGNPEVYGDLLTYNVQKLGVGFATYEMRSSGKGVVSSGAYVSGQTVSGTYNLPNSGTSEVLTFNIKDAGGNSILNCGQSHSFTIIPPCSSVDFAIVPGAGGLYHNQNIQFVADTSSFGSFGGFTPWFNYVWEIGGSFFSSGHDKDIISNIFPEDGVYSHSVKLIASDLYGRSCSVTKNLVLNPTPTCSVTGVTATPSTADFGTNINFSGTISGTGITGYSWKDGATVLGSGALASAGGTAANTHAFAGAANITKTITLTGTLSNGGTCQGTKTVNLTVPAPCTSTFRVLDSGGNVQTEYYYGDDLTFQFLTSSHSPAPISDYHWFVDGTSYINGFAQVHDIFHNPPIKNYNIGLTVDHTDGRSCDAVIQTVKLKDVPPPTCTAAFNAPASGYYDQAIGFDPSISSDTGDSITYTWRKSDDTLLGITNSVTPFSHAFNSSNTSPVGVKLNAKHNQIGGPVCDSVVHSINLSDAPGVCHLSGTPADEYVYDTDVHATTVQTHRLIWEPGKVTYDSFEGTGTAGTNYFHTVITKDIPVLSLVPGDQEWVVFNIYPFADGSPSGDDKDVPPTDVILRDFSFSPAGGASPHPSREAGTYNASTEVVWKGYTWGLRDGGTGDPGFGGWKKSNVTGPDVNGYLTLHLSNPSGNSPSGAEIANMTAGLGYGTYTTVVEGNMSSFDKNVVFEGMFLSFPDPNYPSSTDPCAELNANETASWDDSGSPTVLLSHHNSWYGCGPTGNCPPITPAACEVDFTYNCGSTANCYYDKEISFSAFAVSGTPTTYKWAVDSAGNYFDSDGNTSAKKTFTMSDGASHKIYLSATDGAGNVCTGEQKIFVIKLGAPAWTEIAPLMHLESIAFLILMFFARLIFLRL